jgi:predicted GNAT family acetyltransferase
VSAVAERVSWSIVDGYPATMALEVRRDDGHHRYELVDDDQLVGIADYVLRDSVMVLPHTEIDANRRGHGLGDVLVGGVLDDVRARGLTVVPTCWFVREYIDRHPEAADLLAR